jgi:hypothetical protein
MMTEAEWFASADPTAMLNFLGANGRLSERKARLFSVAACRRIWPLIRSRAYRNLVEAAEQYAEGLCDWDHLRQAESLAYEEDGPQGHDAARWAATHTAGDCVVLWPYFDLQDVSHPHAANAAADPGQEYRAQAVLLRCLVGNPFRSRPPVAPSLLEWHDRLLPRLARAVYEDRHLPEGTLDSLRLAVLADALEDAGYADGELVEHLRGPGPHVRGCHAVDSLLASLTWPRGRAHSHFRLVLQRGARGYFAAVRLEVTPVEGGGLEVEGFDPSEASDSVERGWREGARSGLEYAWGQLPRRPTGALVRLLEIRGMPADTIASRVGYAATYALWEALGFTPSDQLREQTARWCGVPL